MTLQEILALTQAGYTKAEIAAFANSSTPIPAPASPAQIGTVSPAPAGNAQTTPGMTDLLLAIFNAGKNSLQPTQQTASQPTQQTAAQSIQQTTAASASNTAPSPDMSAIMQQFAQKLSAIDIPPKTTYQDNLNSIYADSMGTQLPASTQPNGN